MYILCYITKGDLLTTCMPLNSFRLHTHYDNSHKLTPNTDLRNISLVIISYSLYSTYFFYDDNDDVYDIISVTCDLHVSTRF